MVIRRYLAYGAILVFACATFVWGQEHSAKLEGKKLYTPSRLEWLAVELNATMSIPLTRESGYLMQFVPIANEDTILIYVIYLPSVDREVMNMNISSAREVITAKAQSHGWLSWLKVKEQIQLAKPN